MTFLPPVLFLTMLVTCQIFLTGATPAKRGGAVGHRIDLRALLLRRVNLLPHGRHTEGFLCGVHTDPIGGGPDGDLH